MIQTATIRGTTILALDEYADCLLKQDQSDVALRVLTRGTQLYPGRTDLLYNMAVTQLRMHEPGEAIKTLPRS